MRLLQAENDGHFSLVDYVGNQIPAYAILSHTWGADHEEVTLKDLSGDMEKAKAKAGYRKLEFCCNQAAQDGLRFFWVDTCCIDKSSSAELSEAINSMFRWYSNAAHCYVYLSDVEIDDRGRESRAFRESRWFTRGWTLQELIAPKSVDFYTPNGKRLGDKDSLLQDIAEITGISRQALRGDPLSLFSVEVRMSWAKRRLTKREEDKAYSLLGIFDVSMPLIYGEGEEKAFRRLQEEIDKGTSVETPWGMASQSSPAAPRDDKVTALAVTQRKMQNQISEMAKALDALTQGVERGEITYATVILGSATDASISMSTMIRFLQDLLRSYADSDIENPARFSNVQWLQDQFNDIWADVQTAAAAQLRKRRKKIAPFIVDSSRSENHSSYFDDESVLSLQQEVGRKFTSICRKRKSPMRTSTMDINLPIGNIHISLNADKEEGQVLGATLSYFPALHMQYHVRGISAACLRDPRTDTIARSLSTYCVIPHDSQPLEYIREGDLDAVRRLLTERQIHPNDRDEFGQSLLLIALEQCQFRMCQMLLQEGANPIDCNSRGESLLCAFINQLHRYSRSMPANICKWLSSAVESNLRVFIWYCGVDTGVTVRHQDDDGRSGQSFVPVIHQVMGLFPDSDADEFLFLPIQQLAISGSDLEETDGFGFTVLLGSLQRVRPSQLVRVVTILLQYGANPLAVSKSGIGLLLEIIMLSSACEKAYARPELSQPIQGLLTKLILLGCKLGRYTINPISPSEQALSPSTWVIWCNALDAAGVRPREVLDEDDRMDGITVDPDYVDSIYHEIRNDEPPDNSQAKRSTEVCHLCQLPNAWYSARFPFSAFGRYLFRWDKRTVHCARKNHLDGASCSNWENGSTCGHADHQKYKTKFPPRDPFGLSVRKHVALRLWEDGTLSDPRQAYIWAYGVSPD